MSDVSKMNWLQVEAYLQKDNRAILPLGSTEQHAYLSLSVDSILAHKLALDAAEPLGIPVFPVVPYGITPYFMAYPGTITLQPASYFQLLEDILSGMVQHGFRRILLVNGHGGNMPAQSHVDSWAQNQPHVTLKFHNWWNAPKTWAKTVEIDPQASHASWSENFPWTRLEGVEMPADQKAMVEYEKMGGMTPQQIRDYLGDGSWGGFYQRLDEEMNEIWQVAIAETREILNSFN